MALVVHPHFHPRRTGVTRHVEAVVPALARSVETRAIGPTLPASLPRIRLGELLRRAGGEEVVWHAHRNNELLAGLLLRLLRPKLRVVFTRHSTTRPSRYTRFLARRADAIVALTEEVRAAIALPSTVVPHGIELARFTPPPDRAAAWRQLGLGGARGIGVVGRVRPEKGQGDFVAAVRPLLQRHPDWQAVLVGAVKSEDRAWAAGLTGERVAQVGEQAEIHRWYQGLTLFVHPSHREAFSMALLEAMASGCCVVASKLPAMEQVIDHGRTGFLFPPGDVAALRSQLEPLMADPDRAEQIGRAAAEDIRRRFGVQQEAEALAQVYARAWGR